MSSPHRKHPNASRLASAIACACAIAALTLLTSAALAQEQHPPVEGLAVLPRDLSPWSMFMNADVVVKAVMIGLVIASIVTWTVWLAKTIELLKARRQARAALAALNAIQTLRTVKPSNLRGTGGKFLRSRDRRIPVDRGDQEQRRPEGARRAPDWNGSRRHSAAGSIAAPAFSPPSERPRPSSACSARYGAS